ncbi:hypothetical protein LIER_30574 [Lithospermum erythrorhizon]|uniref:Uncharacterized protein n=1 Tax=Lithospermum erythrorhizon TaxID=34254 RepID=A0AAV3RTY5_LITER
MNNLGSLAKRQKSRPIIQITRKLEDVKKEDDKKEEKNEFHILDQSKSLDFLIGLNLDSMASDDNFEISSIERSLPKSTNVSSNFQYAKFDDEHKNEFLDQFAADVLQCIVMKRRTLQFNWKHEPTQGGLV